MTKTRDPVIMSYTQRIINKDDPSKTHWVHVLCENIAATFPETDVVPIVRLKTIKHDNRNGFALKQNRNRVRITLIPNDRDGTVEALVYDMPTPVADMVNKPRYGHTPVATQRFSYLTELHKLREFCVTHLSKQTPYSLGTYDKIAVTAHRLETEEDLFYAAVIKTATYDESDCWQIYCKDGEIFKIPRSSLAGNRPQEGYYFVYQSDKAATIVTDTDFQRYYQYED